MKQQSRSRHIVRRIVSTILLLLAVIGVLLGEPSIKIFWLVVGVSLIWWDVSASQKQNIQPTNKEVSKKSDKLAAKYLLIEADMPTSESKTKDRSTKTRAEKSSKTRKLLFVGGWILAIVSLFATNQALTERDKLKDQLAAQANPTVNHSLVIEDPQLDYVNAVRAKHGVASLQYDDGLLKSAALKTQDMIDRQYWSHTTPEGKDYYEAVRRTRPGLRLVGENIAECFTTHKQAYRSYEQSPGHFKTMTDPSFTLFGGSTKWDKQKECFVNTNHFGG